MLRLLGPPPPGQGLIHPAEAEVGAEEGKADRRLAQQRGEQRGV
jgi:hypothetical protein